MGRPGTFKSKSNQIPIPLPIPRRRSSRIQFNIVIPVDLRNSDSEAGSYGFNLQGHQPPPDAPHTLYPHKTVHEGKCSTRFQVTCDSVSCSKTKSGTEKFHEHPSCTTSSRGISRRKTGNTISRRAQSRGKNSKTISRLAQSSRGDHNPAEVRTDTKISKQKYL